MVIGHGSRHTFQTSGQKEDQSESGEQGPTPKRHLSCSRTITWGNRVSTSPRRPGCRQTPPGPRSPTPLGPANSYIAHKFFEFLGGVTRGRVVTSRSYLPRAKILAEFYWILGGNMGERLFLTQKSKFYSIPYFTSHLSSQAGRLVRNHPGEGRVLRVRGNSFASYVFPEETQRRERRQLQRLCGKKTKKGKTG